MVFAWDLAVVDLSIWGLVGVEFVSGSTFKAKFFFVVSSSFSFSLFKLGAGEGAGVGYKSESEAR